MKYLEGPKIRLSKFSDQFVTSKYLNWLNDSDVNKYLYVGRFLVCRNNITIPDDEKKLMFAIMSNIGVDSDNQLWQDDNYNHYIGTCSLHNIDWVIRKGEIGYMLGDKHYWGIGMATELVGLLADYGFGKLNLNKITAGVVEGNIGSTKALEKNGFKQFATFEQDFFVDGKLVNYHYFHKFREWHEQGSK